MDSSEYKLLELTYTDEERKRIDEYNKMHVDKSYDLLKFNREKMQNNKEYASLPLEERIKAAQGLEEFKDYCREYPIVSKYIISFGLFSKKAFIKYLEWKAKVRPSDSMRARLMKNQREQEKFKNKYLYAVYVKYLYQEKRSHDNLSDLNSIYMEIVKSLNEDVDRFFDLYDKEVKKQEQNKKSNDEERKQKIISQLKRELNTKNQ